MSWNIADLFKNEDRNHPPVDILSFVAGLVVFAVISFWLAFLVPFSGPAIEAGSSYQILAGLQWVVAGAIFIFLAVRMALLKPSISDVLHRAC
jgi:threonine/homoserine/homoserine lactone efflux protein